MAKAPVAELLRREGAIAIDAVLPWVASACDVLSSWAAQGVASSVEVESLRVTPGDRDVELEPRPFRVPPPDLGRAQVAACANLAYELIKGSPPGPEPFAPEAWVGVRPELARVLSAAMHGTGAASPADLALQLRRGLSSGTAVYSPPKVADTLPRAQPQRRDRVGELLGAYELVRCLGEGGMGEVYLARHVRLGREVAIKLLKPELLESPDVVHRFFQEAKVVNDINHPHIVQISDFVELPGLVYLVMELLQGQTLATLVALEPPLSLQRIANLVGQVSEALVAVHARGVVHRDIKPDNLFVTSTPSGAEFIKVLDFGIARTASSSRTELGAVLGTPHYMSPEQAAGRSVDASTDVYAVGVTMYELLTGRSLAQQSPQALTRTARGESVPPPVAQLVASCLELDAAKRPTMASVLAVLKAAPRSRPVARLAVTLGAAVVGLAAVVALVIEAHPGSAPVLEADESLSPPVHVERVTPAPPAQPPTRVVATIKPATSKRAPPPVDATLALKQRLDSLAHRYDALVSKYGAAQLTTIEREAERAARAAPSAESISAAESALDDAEQRLNQ